MSGVNKKWESPPNKSKSRIFLLLSLATFLLNFLIGKNVDSHEINSNKISLIMREKNHISMILNLNLLKAMNQVVSPQTKYGDFVLSFSNIDPKTFQREYEKTKYKIISGITIYSKDQTKLNIKEWKWPDPKVVQSQFQVYVMELVTGSHDHNKDPISEITAEIIEKKEQTNIQIQVLKEIQPVLFISYRPSTSWSIENKPTSIDF